MLQVWKIEDFLTKWEGTCSGASATDPGKAAIAVVLLQEIDAYRYHANHNYVVINGGHFGGAHHHARC